MKTEIPRICIGSCPKTFTRDMDKAIPPAQTLENVGEKLAAIDLDIFAGARRVDTGRLGIPVYLGLCGQDARLVMPARKQMGKGASAVQAQASAIMELMERFAFFSFFEAGRGIVRATWSGAEKMFGERLLPLSEMLKSVEDDLDWETAKKILDLTSWNFYPATRLDNGEIVWLPLDWFRMLGEYNGSSAGNTVEESLMQGLCELIERHACALLDQNKAIVPTIDPDSCHNSVLASLINAFKREKINLILKDVSGGMPLPVVAALAWDPATFPASSEIVFTAGAASSPAKAAIRAITEVAQLGGDFRSNSRYEASGLPKFTELSQFQWLLEGQMIKLDELPSLEDADIGLELRKTLAGLAPIKVYGVETTNPLLNVPAHYCIAPGLKFRERDRNQSLGLFVGRKLAETSGPEEAAAGLAELERLLGQPFYSPFFAGLLALREGKMEKALARFREAQPLQPDGEARAMACFYAGYVLSLRERWQDSIPELAKAAALCPDMKEYHNLLGVARYKTGAWAEALECFDKALGLDKGSAIDLANRGLCREMLGQPELAMEDFETALNLDPNINFAAEHLAALAGKTE